MTTLDEEEALLLTRARQEFTPRSQQAERVRAAVLGAVAMQSGNGLAQGAASGSKTSLNAGAAGGSKLAAVTQGLGALGAKTWLLGVALTLGAATGAGLLALSASKSKPQPAAITVSAPPARSEQTALVEPPPPSLVPAEAPAEQEPAQQEQTTPRQRLHLRDELASVRDAENALNARDPARALSILDELARFAGGDLREERAALRVLAHCQLGSASAQSRAQGFLRAYGSSVYAARVRAACQLND